MKLAWWVAIVAVVVGTFGAACEAAAAPVVANPSFEAVPLGSPFFSSNPADVPDWTHTGNVGDALLWGIGYGDCCGNITVAGDGNQFVTLRNDGMWSQTVTGFTPGQDYTLTFKMADECCDVGESITVSFLGSSTPSQAFSAGASAGNYWKTWESKSMTFHATATDVALQFSAPTVGRDVGLDAVNVSNASSVVPEPSTMLLLGSGLASVAVFARRRRRK